MVNGKDKASYLNKSSPAFSMKLSHFSASFTLMIRCSGAYKFEKDIAWKGQFDVIPNNQIYRLKNIQTKKIEVHTHVSFCALKSIMIKE